MKVVSKIGILLLLLCTLTAVMVGCAEQVSDISVKKANMPKLTYVQGQELDFSAGKLSVKVGDEVREIAMTDENVKIEGYDPATLGKQTVTVSYRGKTATLDVTVLPRMSAENVELTYFVGETFNREKGHVRINKDDGTSMTVAMNDEKLTVSGFDSANPGDVALNLTYGEYTGSITVKVYAVASTDLHKPTKTAYQSHDASIDLTGGYITFKSAGGELTRFRELSADMVSGFDLSAATAENRENPLVQTLQVSYAGHTYNSFDITITYSDVSLFLSQVAELPALDFTGETAPAVSAEVGEKALDAMRLYYTLSATNRKAVAGEKLDSLVRIVAVYGLDAWQKAVASFADTFVLKDNAITIVAKTYATTKADLARLKDANEPLNALGSFLPNVAADFPDVTLFGENLVGLYLGSVYETKEYEDTIARLEYVIGLYEATVNVPASWTAESLSAASAELDGALAYITSGAYTTRKDNTLFRYASAWRSGNDLVEILYTYAYGQKNTAAIGVMKNIILPGKLETLYEQASLAMAYVQYLSGGRMIDSTYFLAAYAKANSLLAELTKSKDMYGDLANTLTFAGFLTKGNQPYEVTMGALLSFMRTTKMGLYQVLGTAQVNDDLSSLVTLYIDTVSRVLDDADYRTTEDYGKRMELIFSCLSTMTPGELDGFFQTIAPYYMSGYPAMMWDTSDGYTNYLVNLLDGYYKTVLTEKAYATFGDLMLAMESFARAQGKLDFAAFRDNIAAVSAAYNALGETDQGNFDKYLGAMYQHYLTAAEYVKETDPKQPNLGEWQAKVDELGEYLSTAISAYSLINGANSTPVYSLFLSAAERARTLYADIRENAPAEVREALSLARLYQMSSEVSVSYDYAYFYINYYQVTLLRGLTISGNYLIDLYRVYSDTPAALSATAYMIKCYAKGDAYADVDAVLSGIRAFRAMNVYNQKFYLILDGNFNTYYGALRGFTKQYLSYKNGEESTPYATDAVEALIAFEEAYRNYVINPDGTNATAGKTNKAVLADAMDALRTAYNALKADEQTAFETYTANGYSEARRLYGELKLN